MDENIRSILVWGPNWIGDIVLSIPTVRTLKNRFPESRLVYVVRSPFGHILERETSIDELIPYNPSGEHRTLSGKFSLTKKLRQYRFDLSLSLPNSFRAGVMLFLSGARRRVGYGSDGRSFLLTHALPARKRKDEGHRVDYFLDLAAKAGCRQFEKRISLKITKAEREEVQNILSDHGVGREELLIGLHPGASKPPRTLAPKCFSKICRAIREKWKAKVLLLGSSSERSIVQQVLSGVDQKSVFTLGQNLPLRTTAALIERCHYFIGCDSGLMHLAAGVGTPVVGIFGPGAPEHTAPVCSENKKAIIFHRFPCSPCRQRFFKDCEPSPEGRPPCIEKIKAEEIIAGLEKLMEES